MSNLGPCPTGCGRFADLTAYVMCPRCWRRVPKPLRVAVLRAWDERKAAATGRAERQQYAAKVTAHEAAKAAAIRAAS